MTVCMCLVNGYICITITTYAEGASEIWGGGGLPNVAMSHMSAQLDNFELSVFVAILCTSVLPLKKGCGEGKRFVCFVCIILKNLPEIMDSPLLCLILAFPDLVTNFETLLLFHWFKQLLNTRYSENKTFKW